MTKQEEMDTLIDLRNDYTRPFMQHEQDKLDTLIKEVYHGHCLNPHCVGYTAKKEEENHCKFCGKPLYKKD